MKIKTTIMVLLITCLSAFQIMAKDKPKLTGTEEEVAAQIVPDFPAGMTRDQVITVLRQKYDLPLSEINITNSESAIEHEHDGKKLAIHSWIRATIYEYRSMRSLFTKNYVVSYFYFDEDKMLAYFAVCVYHGPDL